ncbi:MAG: LpxI family protein [Elusimicrobiales bacterium]
MSERIGFIIGGGDLARICVENAVKEGLNVFVAGFDGITDREIERYNISFEFFKLGELARIIDFFNKNSVKKVVIIGKVSHINVFKDIKVDMRGALFLMKLKDKTPTGIFKAIEDELLKDGIEVESPLRFLSNNLLPHGVLCGEVSKDEIREIEYGFNIAKRIASMDIGLSVMIKDYCVVAVEGIEGTDACIRRAGQLCGKNSGFIMVKVARPNQDVRFDLPVIGPSTVENIFEAGGRIIAAEADKTVVADIKKTIEIACDKGVSIYGVREVR